ncbi:MAG: DEAD/DEAH box helicase, partial [Planctomycetia bacterium]|nr:DEAD/DEAH box helicase [Planctomycetia bacterium]
CKHIEAVLATLGREAPERLKQRKAAITRPEVFLQYGEQLRLGLHLPPRHTDPLGQLAATFFDPAGRWQGEGGDRYAALLEAIQQVPEPVTILSDAMEFIQREIDRDELAKLEQHLLERLDQGDLNLELLNVPLYPYQVRGALFLGCRGRSILGDDMGLGKTVQTLAAVELLAKERGIERVLVVAPSSVKYQWETEIKKFTSRPVQVIEGSSKQRRGQYGKPTFYRLINYEAVVKDLESLNAWQPDLIVLDEAQRIKNWESKTSQAVKKLRSQYAFVLTGTPLENKLEELYSIVQFVDDRRLGPAFQFLHDHRVLDREGKLQGYRRLDEVREKLTPVFLRRTRAEVLGQLPARTDSTVYVEMSDSQREAYREQQTTLAQLVSKPYLSELDRRRIMCCITNLRMLCDSTFLFDKKTHVSPKLDELAELLRDLLTAGPHKAVIFSQWEVMLHETAAQLERLGIGHVLLAGSVPGKERRALMERFRDDDQCRVFLSTDAGGTGLNLQSADTVINLEVPWNPAVREQRIARVHRLGQHRPVQVINLVTRGSIEERVLKTAALKQSLFEGVFADGSDEVSFESLGQKSLLDTMRELVGEAAPRGAEPTEPTDPRLALLENGVQFLEALAALSESAAEKPAWLEALVTEGNGRPQLQLPLPSPELIQRGAAALTAIVRGLSTDRSERRGLSPP